MHHVVRSLLHSCTCTCRFAVCALLAPLDVGVLTFCNQRAKQSGWDLVILSDMLVLRQYSSHDAWRPGPMRVQAGDSLPIAPATAQPGAQSSRSLQEMLAAIVSIPEFRRLKSIYSLIHLLRLCTLQPEPQRSLVMQICQRTGLNVEYAVQCLEGNAWDVQRAVANFEQVKVRDFDFGWEFRSIDLSVGYSRHHRVRCLEKRSCNTAREPRVYRRRLLSELSLRLCATELPIAGTSSAASCQCTNPGHVESQRGRCVRHIS